MRTRLWIVTGLLASSCFSSSYFSNSYLFSSYANASHYLHHENVIDSNNTSYPDISILKNKDGSSVLTYYVSNQPKMIHIPSIEDNLNYFKVTTRPKFTHSLLEQDELNYLLGDFKSRQFSNFHPVLQVQFNQDGIQKTFVSEFRFDSDKQAFVHHKSYQLSYLNYCGRELYDISEIEYQGNANKLEHLDFKALHHALFTKGFYKGKKVIPDILLDKYQKLMDTETTNKKEVIRSLIHTDNSRSGYRCPADEYIAHLYYFEDNLRLSNNLAKSFAQEGYHLEAIELFKQILYDKPNKADVYLHLADSYKALGNTRQAEEYYKQYNEKMSYKDSIHSIANIEVTNSDTAKNVTNNTSSKIPFHFKNADNFELFLYTTKYDEVEKIEIIDEFFDNVQQYTKQELIASFASIGSNIAWDVDLISQFQHDMLKLIHDNPELLIGISDLLSHKEISQFAGFYYGNVIWNDDFPNEIYVLKDKRPHTFKLFIDSFYERYKVMSTRQLNQGYSIINTANIDKKVIREQSNYQSPIVGTIEKNSTVKALWTEGDWVFVYSGENIGYIHSNSLIKN